MAELLSPPGNYSDIQCPASVCSFANEPWTPYYWDDFCQWGMLGPCLKKLSEYSQHVCASIHLYSAAQDVMRTAFTSSVASVTRLGQSSSHDESGLGQFLDPSPLCCTHFVLGHCPSKISGFTKTPPPPKIRRSRVSVFQKACTASKKSLSDSRTLHSAAIFLQISVFSTGSCV